MQGDDLSKFANNLVDDAFSTAFKELASKKQSTRPSQPHPEPTHKTTIRGKSNISMVATPADRDRFTKVPSSRLTVAELEDLYEFMKSNYTSDAEKVLTANRAMWGRKVAARLAHTNRNLHNRTPISEIFLVPAFQDERHQLWYESPDKTMIKVPARLQVEGEAPVGVLREFKKLRLFVEEGKGTVWFAQPWYFNVFHKPWKFVKFLSSDSFVHPEGRGSSELIVLTHNIQNGRVKPEHFVEASYNFSDRPTVGWQRHWLADVLTNFFYCEKIGS
eukprot:c13779_g1_i2.p2 GENE.c13779_g1_i2~~c13779_g1_i2.p2  ORF type:complete len:291 (+),score=57.38 c13779_g1_i2:49-873(+)